MSWSGVDDDIKHDETSAHGLWTKLEEMYWEKTSQNKALMRRLVLKLQRGTTVAEQMSEFQRRGHMKRSKEEAKEEVSRRKSQRSRKEVKKEIPADDGGGQNPETGGLYRLEESVQTGGAAVRHRSSGISKKNGQGKQPLHRGMQSKRRNTRRMYLKDPKWYRSARRCFEKCVEVWPDKSDATSAGCPWKSSEERDRVDVQRQARRRRNESLSL
ncbi:hypothetical protein Acr_07g0011540 [Actinidia rufa]|uniref:Uncharacterized protein n=1 Tax=Actinidia rufa TaxID=165716 RepID=A0A7J0EX32_9ERIC|nr:hypothetical protein Acr_07g0011540 [Actinidia rufa]